MGNSFNQRRGKGYAIQLCATAFFHVQNQINTLNICYKESNVMHDKVTEIRYMAQDIRCTLLGASRSM